MKKLILLIPAVLVTGCMNTSSLVRSLSKDPASVHLSIKSIYANMELTRVNPNENTPSYTISPDGTVSVKRESVTEIPVSDNLGEAIRRIPIPR